MYIGLEVAAAKMSKHEPELVPGLFQTEDYARMLFKVEIPGADEAEIERRVKLRMTRQAIVRRPIDPPLLQVAIGEQVLRRPVGGPAVMASQLAKLIEASQLPNVALRVVPFSAGYHPGMVCGSFTILRFPLNVGGVESEPPTVYSDLYTGALYLDKPNEVEHYSQAFGTIWDAALDEDTSRDQLSRAAEDMRDE
jgi:hypothetical protein